MINAILDSWNGEGGRVARTTQQCISTCQTYSHDKQGNFVCDGNLLLQSNSGVRLTPVLRAVLRQLRHTSRHTSAQGSRWWGGVPPGGSSLSMTLSLGMWATQRNRPKISEHPESNRSDGILRLIWCFLIPRQKHWACLTFVGVKEMAIKIN